MDNDSKQSMGGKARAVALSRRTRAEIARKAAAARWEVHKRTHPLRLLLQTLPEPGAELDSHQVASWLRLANSALDMVYKTEQGGVQIQIIVLNRK